MRMDIFSEIARKSNGRTILDTALIEIAELREQVEKLKAAYDQCGRTVQEYGRTITQTESRLREVATHCANVEEQLAALAEQNEKFRETLSRWRYQNLSYNWCCGNCGAVDGDEHKEGCALSLPDLATPVLNRIKAEAYREVALYCDSRNSKREYPYACYAQGYDDAASDCADAIRSKADELEQSK